MGLLESALKAGAVTLGFVLVVAVGYGIIVYTDGFRKYPKTGLGLGLILFWVLLTCSVYYG